MWNQRSDPNRFDLSFSSGTHIAVPMIPGSLVTALNEGQPPTWA